MMPQQWMVVQPNYHRFCAIKLNAMLLVLTLVALLGLVTASPHPCLRECSDPPQPKTCHYDFEIETYLSMSKACYDCPINKTDCLRPHCVALNGVRRMIMTVNRQLPGPSIEVCEGDKIVVNVKNHLQNGEGASIHWHGFHVRNEQYMDGVGMLTQCPIPAFSNFTYTLNATNVGTHWWHAHTGMHRSDGIFGVLTVRQPRSQTINSDTYDQDLPEHNFVVHDWFDTNVLDEFLLHHHVGESTEVNAILVNGKGKRKEFKDPDTNATVFTDREVFTVKSGTRYRFRVASNAVTDCPLKLSIDNHTLTIIASDGATVEPYETEILIIYGGERFDFVVNANQPVANYWFRFKGLLQCEETQGLAIVRYEGASETDPVEAENYDRQGLTVNPINSEASKLNIPVVQLNSTDSNDITSEKADITYYIPMGFKKIDNPKYNDANYYPISLVDEKYHTFMTQLNDVSFQFPFAPPLSQYDDIIDSLDVCTPESLETRNCKTEFCECTQVINVKLGQVVELVLIEKKLFASSHPMHLHGHLFRVVGMDNVGAMATVEDIKAMDKAGNITRKLDKAVKKDTVIVPDGGYTIIRFLADNPGWWLFHCHIEFHKEIGMALVIHTGTQRDLPPVPAGFPRCGAFSCDSCQSAAKTCPTEKSAAAPRVHNFLAHFIISLFSLLILASA